MTCLLRRILLSALAAATPGALAAANPHDLTALPLEQLLNLEVVTASKIPQKISEVPATVSVVTADDIRQFGYRSLADILRSVSGIHVSYDRNYSYAGTRGVARPGDYNTRILVLVDGRRLNDAAYDEGAAGTEFPVDVELIDRVEFVAGPGSAIYGSSAFFGVVNVITKSAALKRSELALAHASYGTHSGRATVALRRDDGSADLLLSASGLSSRGQDLYFPEFDDAASNNGVANGLDYDRYRRLFAKLRVRGLVAEAHFGRRTKGVPTASYGQRFNDPRSLTMDEYTGAGLSYDAPLSDTLQLYGNLSANRYRYDGDYLFAPGPTVNRDPSEARTFGAELRLLSTAVRGHRLVAGAEYRDDARRRMVNYDINPYVSYLDVDIPKRGYGLYVQDEIRLGETIVVNAGLRHDHDGEGGNANSPRLALLYKPTPRLTAKLLYGTAFRSANAYERYYASSSEYKLNPNLDSEHVRTGELALEYFPIDRFRARASLFEYRITDLIALATDPDDRRLYFSNIDAVRSRGAELEAEWLGIDGDHLKANVSFQLAKDQHSGEWLSNSPRGLFKLNYSTPLLGDAMRAGVEFQCTGRRRTPLNEEIGGFGVTNLTLLSRQFGPHLQLSASIYNLLGKRYADPPGEEHYDNSNPPRYLRALRQPGRNWRVVLTHEF